MASNDDVVTNLKVNENPIVFEHDEDFVKMVDLVIDDERV